MARLVVTAAQQDNGCAVTSGLVDAVMELHASTEPGKANKVFVRQLAPGSGRHRRGSASSSPTLSGTGPSGSSSTT
ncbi:hypothetical protein [Streptomyces sp. NPDC051572]|uniref:hypothetical protein n=1 Tax=Streptomyces sp. NPDC051572 TaxID=3155802 RepID=UPI00344FE352